MTPPRKKTRTKTARKSKAPAKKSTRKTPAKKAPPRKSPAKKPAAKKLAPKKTSRTPRQRTAGEAAPRRSRARGGARSKAKPPGAGAGGSASRLGTKYTCFDCGAKFYDLNRPEPLCPRCGADQRKRPKVDARASASAETPRRPARSMAPLLEEDEDEVIVEDEELDLGLAGVDSPDGFLADDDEEEEVEET